MNADLLEDFGRRWQDAVNRQAIDEVIAMCREDIRVEDPGLPTAARGHQAVRVLFEQTWKAFPDVHFTRPDDPYLLAPDGTVAAARWSATGTMRGPIDPPGYAPTHTPVAFHGIDIWEFADGLLSGWEGIYDMAEIGRQIGALPPTGSRGERVGARLQRLGARRMRRAAGG
jgi:predicted ester cyclase